MATSVQTIINQILDEAQSNADNIIKDAENQANEILQKANNDADKIKSDAKVKAKYVYDNVYMKAKNSHIHSQKQKSLLEKQNAINNAVESIKGSIINMPDDEYFEFLASLIDKVDTGEKGTIFLGSNDISRMNFAFKAKLNLFKNLELAEDKNLKNGFIIKWQGDILENCSIDALFEENIEAIKEEIYNKFLR